MSNFLKRGLRKTKANERKVISKRIKEVYKILHEMEEVAIEMIKSGIVITEDNVIEEAAKYTEREIGGYEKMILLGKTQQVYEAIKNKQIITEEE